MSNLHNQSWLNLHNPLLDGIPVFSDPREILDALAFDPLKGVDISQLSFISKTALLSGEKTPLEPSTMSLKATITWYGMLQTSLKARNPTSVEYKKIYHKILSIGQAGDTLTKFPTQGISVNLLKGPAGTGKTVTYQRFCEILPQTIEHGKNEAAGWTYFRQLVYLIVPLSHDGARGGFLFGILSEMDKVLETNYATTLPKQYKSLDKLEVATIARLVAHYCGIIFIDEAQLRNLVESGHAEILQLFLLKLMNAGIPIVLAGNEKAFNWINFSQDISRLATTPLSHFHPIGALNEPNWQYEWDVVSQGVMRFYVLDVFPTDPKECKQALNIYGGAIARLALILWCNAQSEALYSGRNSISAKDIKDAYDSYAFKELRPLADGFHYKNASLLSTIPDVDAAFYGRIWRSQTENEIPKTEPKVEPTSTDLPEKQKARDKRSSEETKFKSQQTRQKNLEIKRLQSLKNLSDEDIRKQGLTNHHLKNFDELKRDAMGN
jgi:hypothetical protein